MNRAAWTIYHDGDRKKVQNMIWAAPKGTRIELKPVRRSVPQSDRMWAMLSDVAKQTQWCGLSLTKEDWKLLFLNHLKRELRMVPNLDRTGYVALGTSSSDLSKQEMSDLLEIIAEWGARNGVAFHDVEEIAE